MNDEIQRDNYPEYIEKIFNFRITSGQNPERLDVFLANNIRNASRTKVQQAIEEGYVSINGKPTKSNKKIQPNDEIICKIFKPPPIELVPENIPIEVVYEDEHLLVVNKAAGMVTHPAFGNRYGTLVNAVLYHTGFRESIPIELPDDEDEYDENYAFSLDAIRPGVVHRLDKDTSGLIVVSKNPVIHAALAKQFFDRTISRFYYAFLWGNFDEEHGIIEGDIGRSPRDRKLFAIVKKDGKIAKTEYWVLKRYEYITLVKIKLWTGRTHQIRVHFSHHNHHVLGDVSYGGNKIMYGGNNNNFKKIANKLLETADRQMLHAKVLGFFHPVLKTELFFESNLPKDMQIVEAILDSSLN